MPSVGHGTLISLYQLEGSFNHCTPWSVVASTHLAYTRGIQSSRGLAGGILFYCIGMWRSLVARETSSRGWRSNFIGRGLAQLVARAAGGGEVVGSNPATPTNKIATLVWSQVSLRSSGSSRDYERARISLRSPPPNLVIPTKLKTSRFCDVFNVAQRVVSK